MSTHGRDSNETPDVTARVMQRLGYENATRARARELRRRTAVVRLLQGVIVLSAVVLGAIWWLDGSQPASRGPAVVETLRGGLARGTSELHGFVAALPRLPSETQAALVGATMDASAELPSAALDNAPQLRSY